MNITDEEKRIIVNELSIVMRHYVSIAFGELEQYYLDRADQILRIIEKIEKRA